MISFFAPAVVAVALSQAPEPSQAAASWIASQCATADGALRVRPNGSYVSGYFGTLVAQALVRANERPDLALAWMRWYVAHAHGSGSGIDGVVDDVDIVDGQERTRGRPDSTDAYGAVFLSLARDAYNSTDPALHSFVLAHHEDLRRIMNSSIATIQQNGLTWARPQHRIYYTIDNAQVYRGLIDAADLFRRAFHDDLKATFFEDTARTMKHGIDTVLWDEQTESFRPYMNQSGTSGPANLSQSYPDALAQVFAVYYGVLDPATPRAADLVQRASGALLTQTDPLDEMRLVLLATQQKLGQRIDLPTFEPPPLCVDAAWYLNVLIAQKP